MYINLNPELLDYIALENPDGVDKLFLKQGYEIPSGHEDRVEALVQLIELEGDRIKPGIWALHPDRAVPEALSKESCYCGGCSNYSGNSDTKEEVQNPEPKAELVTKDWLKEQFAAVGKKQFYTAAGLAVLVVLVTALVRHG